MTALTSSSTTERAGRAPGNGTAAARALPVSADEVPVYPLRRLDPVFWISALFIANFFLMRISIPNLNISVSVALTGVWLLLAWKTSIIVIEPRRFILWLVAGGVAALVTLPQILFVHAPFVSLNSWALWMVTWLPAAFMMADRSRATFERALKAIVQIGLWFAGISMAFIGVQLVGMPYRDFLAEIFPPNMLVTDFNTAYPLYYGAWLYKSNGWFTLEPSFMSFILGLIVLAALIVRAPIWKVMWLLGGMIVTAAGSGFFVALIGIVAMVVLGQWRLLKPYIVPGLVLAAVVIPTAIGQVILSRLSEGGNSRSSTALRTVEPYMYLWPKWTEQWAVVVFGGGAGSSRHVVDGSGVRGLMVPTIGKVLFDYGVIAGVLLTALVVVSYVKTVEPSIAFAVATSMLILQPPAQPLMIPAFLMTTLWAPALFGNRPAGTDPEREPDAPRGWYDDEGWDEDDDLAASDLGGTDVDDTDPKQGDVSTGATAAERSASSRQNGTAADGDSPDTNDVAATTGRPTAKRST